MLLKCPKEGSKPEKGTINVDIYSFHVRHLDAGYFKWLPFPTKKSRLGKKGQPVK